MNSYDLYISYTGKNTYLICPLQYYLKYIKKQVVDEDQKKFMLGLITGKVFEWFYNKRYWASTNPVGKCIESVDYAIDSACSDNKLIRGNNNEFFDALKSEVIGLIPSIVQIIKDNRLLTDNSRSEVNLTTLYEDKKSGIKLRLGGKADFIHGKESVWILDGKFYAEREKYVDSNQLIWYSILYYLKYHVAPSRLGFLHYKFIDDPLQWIIYNEQSMRDNLNETINVAISIKDKKFMATPSSKCHRCKFNSICDDGIKHLASRRIASGGRITDSIFGLEELDTGDKA